MSMSLRYAASCDECRRPMRPGTVVDYFKVGDKYGYIHHPECPPLTESTAPPPVSRKTVEDHYHLRECANGHEYAYSRKAGPAPGRCHECGAAWVWFA